MEQQISPERVANAIMQDNSFNGFYFIVEGNKDSKVYGKFINENVVRIREAFGCDKVKAVLKILDERGFNQKIGIIDDDFKSILGVVENIDGLFITDNHDIEIMIINTHALENVLNISCSRKNIQEFEKSNEKTIREIIFNLGKEIGFIKLANKIHDLGLIFKPRHPEGNQIKYKEFISDQTLDYLGDEKLLDTVINYSRNKSKSLKDRSEIETNFQSIKTNKYNLNDLVNGHDLTNILFLLMKKVLKSRSKILADFNSVEDSLVLAYEYSDFKSTNIYTAIDNWAKIEGVEFFK